MGLFNQAGLRKNTEKTIEAIYQPCRVFGTQSKAAYTHRVMGGGTNLPGMPETVIPMFRMYGGPGGRIYGGTLPDAERVRSESPV